MSSGAAEQEQGAVRGGQARMDAVSQAMSRIREGYGSARGELTPYKKLGSDAMNYFDQYKTPGGIADIYQKYSATTDPLNSYYQKKNEEAINRQMAARGKFGGGAAITAQSEASAALQAQMAGLTEQRVQSELGLQERQLQRGIGIGQNLSDLYTGEATQLSGLEQAYGAAKGTMQEQIGAARRTGAQYNTGLMTTALGAGLGFMTGGLSTALTGASLGGMFGGGVNQQAGGQNQPQYAFNFGGQQPSSTMGQQQPIIKPKRGK